MMNSTQLNTNPPGLIGQSQQQQQNSQLVVAEWKRSDMSKISSDYVSILACSPIGNGASYEYFLSLSLPSLNFGLLGTQSISSEESWRGRVDKILQEAQILSQVEGILRLDRWFVPGGDKMSSHVIFALIVKPELKKIIATRFSGLWLSSNDLIEYHRLHKLVSPDILDIALNSCVSCVTGMQVVSGTEFTTKDLVDYETKGGVKLGFDSVVQAAQIGKREQEQLYKEFKALTAPYFKMGRYTFFAFIRKFGWSESILPNLFRTFDTENHGGLTFRELLYGLSTVEPSTQHGGTPAEIRCRYIFRYYDTNGDGKLDFDEFKRLVLDIRESRGLPIDSISVQQDSEKSLRLFGDIPNTDGINIVDFLTAIGQLKFRGTSHLLRSPTSVLNYLRSQMSDETPNSVPPAKSLTGTISLAMNAMPLFDDYDIAAHSIRVRKSGTILDVHSIWDVEHSGMSSKNPDIKLQFGMDRIMSINSFNQESQHNEMLNGLRYFEKAIPENARGGYAPKAAFDWGEVDRSALARSLLTLCQKVKEIMMSEPRLVEIAAPCYILGDIHGNFPDLICFEKALWRLGPILTPASLLFLGDYVDRGIYGVEVVAYLFAQKIIAPHKFTLLRGNHEIREVQQQFTFYRECLDKFGEKLGRDVWEGVNLAFDCMPLAAIVDKKVFCVHGGIPPPWIGDGQISAINTIPCPLPKPEIMSSLSWALMWSDPLHLEMLSPEQRERLKLVDGFGSNLRRGTAHVFNEDALDAFLAKNSLSHVVRAHEVQQAGFQIQLNGKLLTVFSSSKYCGGSNDAACILAEKCKLRTIRIDTA